MTNFTTVRITYNLIEVRSKGGGPVHGFKVGEDPTCSSRWILSPAPTVRVQTNDLSTPDEQPLPEAFAYAEREMLAAGHIDRLLAG